MDAVSTLPTFTTLPSVLSSGHQTVSTLTHNTLLVLLFLQVNCLLWVRSTLLDCVTGQGYVTHTLHTIPPHTHTLHPHSGLTV